MSPRHGRHKPRPSNPDADKHQARVERARYSYDRIAIDLPPDADPEHTFLDWGDPEGSISTEADDE